MRALAILLILLSPLCHAADVLTFKDGSLTVQLLHGDCSPAVAELIQPEYVPLFRAARVEWEGREIAACWTLQGANVVIVDETGSGGGLPVMAFKPVPGA